MHRAKDAQGGADAYRPKHVVAVTPAQLRHLTEATVIAREVHTEEPRQELERHDCDRRDGQYVQGGALHLLLETVVEGLNPGALLHIGAGHLDHVLRVALDARHHLDCVLRDHTKVVLAQFLQQLTHVPSCVHQRDGQRSTSIRCCRRQAQGQWLTVSSKGVDAALEFK